jgi:periplasmic protein TonB
MSHERQRNREETLGSLRGCLVEGGPEQRKLERRIRWHALAISIALQSAALVALVLVPLFGKPQRLVLAKDFVPIPPYHHNNGPAHGNPSTTPRRPYNFTLCLACPIHNSPTQRPNLDEPPQDVDLLASNDSSGFDRNCSGCINIPGPEGPRTPQIPDETLQKRLQITRLDPAMLIYRVEPVYPALARQTGRSGRVELRAIIATDGTIQSLQVVSGDPLFIQSALQAVQQWRYKPTVLNGRPVEIDTFITVVYTINR